MRIYERTLIAETVVTSAVVSLVAIGIYVVGKIVALLRRAVQGNVPADELLVILGLKLVSFIDVILTPVLYVAILLVFLRWTRDQEITIYFASGVGPFQYAISLCVIVSMALALIAPLTLFLAPAAERNYDRLLHEFKQTAKYIPFESGEFISSKDGNRVIFFLAESGSDAPYRLFHYERGETDTEYVTVVGNGSINYDADIRGPLLTLEKGMQYQIQDGVPTYETMSFDRFQATLNPSPTVTFAIPPAGKTIHALLSSDRPDDIAEFWWRVSKMTMVPIVICGAFVLGSVPLGKGYGINLFVAVGLYFLYSSLVGVAIQQIRNQSDYSLTLLWALHALAFVVTMVVVVRFLENRRPVPRFFQSKF